MFGGFGLTKVSVYKVSRGCPTFKHVVCLFWLKGAKLRCKILQVEVLSSLSLRMHQTPPPVCHACIEAQAKDLWQKSINDKLRRLAASCDKISEKVNYQERRMMYGGQGARIE